MNKKIRTLAIVNVLQIVVLVASIIVSAFILPDIMIFTNSDSHPAVVVQGSETDIYNGYADVTAYGAVPNDDKDDTSAFLAAAKTGAGIYVPLGTFDISKTVELKGQHLKGAGLDRSIVRYCDSGTIVDLSGAAMITDITLTFKDITADNNDCIAIYDNGITNGAAIRSVKLLNVGTGIYAPNTQKSDATLSIESLVIDKFSHKAIDIKDANSIIFRALHIKEALGEVDAAITIGGNFTFDTVCFTDTNAQYMMCFDKADSAVLKSVVFESVQSKSGSAIKSISSTLSFQTIVVKDSTLKSFIKIDDADTKKTTGSIITLIGDSGKIKIDDENRIQCKNNLSQ